MGGWENSFGYENGLTCVGLGGETGGVGSQLELSRVLQCIKRVELVAGASRLFALINLLRG